MVLEHQVILKCPACLRFQVPLRLLLVLRGLLILGFQKFPMVLCLQMCLYLLLDLWVHWLLMVQVDLEVLMHQQSRVFQDHREDPLDRKILPDQEHLQDLQAQVNPVFQPIHYLLEHLVTPCFRFHQLDLMVHYFQDHLLTRKAPEVLVVHLVLVFQHLLAGLDLHEDQIVLTVRLDH